MNRFIIAALLLGAWLIRWSAAAAALPTGFTESVVSGGISSPTTMQFAPDGRLFVCQKNGQLRVIKNGLLLANPVVSLPVDPFNERGLLGVAFDPDFTTNNCFYVYYTATNATTHNRVSRFMMAGDTAVPGSETILLELNDLGAGLHNGGALNFGPDRKLYIATGENGFAPNSQALTNLLGKILRINPDGSIPTNNPFYGIATGANQAIWAMGLRNPFTFAFQPGTGRMFINDVGEMTWEEINEGFAGANYGWPTCEGLCDPPNGNFRNPLFQYGHLIDDPNLNGCAIIGAAFFNPVSSAFPTNFLGSYFFADYCNGWIRNLNPAGNTATLFATGLVAPVDLKVSAAGDLYYLSRSSGEVRRIQFTNTPPNVTSQPGDQTVMVGESAAFSVAASGPTQLAYQWQRNSTNVPGATNTSYSLPSVVLADNDSVFRCVVTNIFGSVTSNPALLIVTTNNDPTPVITLSGTDGYYTAGDTIAYGGIAPDLEDGFVQPASFIWTIVFHHAAHTHPFLGPLVGVTNGSFTIPALGEVSTNVWYRIELLVIDSLGGQGTTYVDIHPHTANLTLDSSPPGLRVALDGQPTTGPSTIPAVVGMVRTLGVFTPQTLNGTNYEFEAWSDAGAVQHDITVPSTNVSYTAVYHFAGIVTNPMPPKLLSQPMSQQVLQGFPADFSVIADGDLPMRYQWYFNATN
ncbi:MAG TPA: PQQ-dependent sugar dehydrogenase, partial [Verrucomicrobiae bacterium]